MAETRNASTPVDALRSRRNRHARVLRPRRVPADVRHALLPGRGLLLNTADTARQAGAEFLGTGLLVAVIIGSGIAAERLSPGDAGLRLLENSTATAFGIAVLVLVLVPGSLDDVAGLLATV